MAMLCRNLQSYLFLWKEVSDRLWHFIFFEIILEVADQLALLGINTDDRQVPFSELDALLGDVGELLVAVGAGAMSDALWLTRSR